MPMRWGVAHAIILISTGACIHSIAAAPFDDPNSQANAAEFYTSALHFDLTVDFSRQVLTGAVDIWLSRVAPLCSEVGRGHGACSSSVVVLDTQDLNIRSVSCISPDAEQLQFSVGPKLPVLGSGLSITLSGTCLSPTWSATPDSADVGRPRAAGAFGLRIAYETTANATSAGLQWLSVAQTKDKKGPYLFAQCESIFARTVFPCQDTPFVKAPYTAAVTVPSPLTTVVMSAQNVGNATNADGSVTFRFHQPVPLVSYLIVLTAGVIEYSAIDARTGVWAEPSLSGAAAWEFHDADTFVGIAERLVGMPYPWGTVVLNVMPPSFPFGGMENPNSITVTPTLLAGDRSLEDVIAHELAHSWTGDLVTNANWEHFWLNEGWTMLLQRKIVGAFLSADYTALDIHVGWKALSDDVASYLQGNQSEYTKLVPNLRGGDPQDAFSNVPYEKGFHLLYKLQSLVGGEAAFTPFMQAYIKQFAYKSLTSWEFRDFFVQFFAPRTIALDWDLWLSGTGMPPVNISDIPSTLADAALSLAARWTAASVDPSQFSPKDVAGWSSLQQQVFLDNLDDAVASLTLARLAAIGTTYNLTSPSQNDEIKFRWYRLSLKLRDAAIVDAAVAFMTAIGRTKFVAPLYKVLSQWQPELARSTYAANKAFYHPACRAAIEKALAPAQGRWL